MSHFVDLFQKPNGPIGQSLSAMNERAIGFERTTMSQAASFREIPVEELDIQPDISDRSNRNWMRLLTGIRPGFPPVFRPEGKQPHGTSSFPRRAAATATLCPLAGFEPALVLAAGNYPALCRPTVPNTPQRA